MSSSPTTAGCWILAEDGRPGFPPRTHTGRATCYTLSRDEPYRDLGPDWLRRRDDDESHARRVVSQLDRLGHTVVLDAAA